MLYTIDLNALRGAGHRLRLALGWTVLLFGLLIAADHLLQLAAGG